MIALKIFLNSFCALTVTLAVLSGYNSWTDAVANGKKQNVGKLAAKELVKRAPLQMTKVKRSASLPDRYPERRLPPF